MSCPPAPSFVGATGASLLFAGVLGRDAADIRFLGEDGVEEASLLLEGVVGREAEDVDFLSPLGEEGAEAVVSDILQPQHDVQNCAAASDAQIKTHAATPCGTVECGESLKSGGWVKLNSPTQGQARHL